MTKTLIKKQNSMSAEDRKKLTKFPGTKGSNLSKGKGNNNNASGGGTCC